MSDCQHRVDRKWCGLCGGLNGRHPAMKGTERGEGYEMPSGDWQLAMWDWDDYRVAKATMPVKEWTESS